MSVLTKVLGDPNAREVKRHLERVADISELEPLIEKLSSDELQALLQPYPAERMEAHMIGPEIGNVKNDSAGLIERLKSA